MNETRILMPIPTADRNEALVQRYNSLHENLENNHYTDVHQFLTMNLIEILDENLLNIRHGMHALWCF